jgi:hypothetical protein
MTRPDRYSPRPMRPDPQSAVPLRQRSSPGDQRSEGGRSTQASDIAGSDRFATRTRKRRLASRWTLVALSLVLLGISIPLALSRQGEEEPQPRPPAPTTPAPPRVSFAFTLDDIRTSTTGAGGKKAAAGVASDIQTSLSGFYDQAFLDPLARTEGIPLGVWEVFADTLRDRAAEDSEALTLGEVATQVAVLEVTRSSLDVQVLLDPRGRPYAALAEVVFRAAGEINSGEQIRVINRASFIFRPSSGVWLIIGYPSADTTVKTATDGEEP